MYKLTSPGVYKYGSKDSQFVWCDVPKVASTTIRNVLKKQIIDFRTVEANHAKKMSINEFEEIERSGFSFAFVRNPWDRLISNYFMLIKNQHPGAKNIQKNYKKHYQIDFSKDIKSFYSFCLSYDKFFECKSNPSATNHLLPQTEFIPHNVDFIGRFENLQQDFNTICDKIGIPHQELPHKNATKHKHYTEYYDEETKSIVAKKYAKDIEYFGYKFGE